MRGYCMLISTSDTTPTGPAGAVGTLWAFRNQIISCDLPTHPLRFFSRPRRREIRVLSSCAFPGQFGCVRNTLAFVLFGLPSGYLGPIVLSGDLKCRCQLGKSCSLSEFSLFCTCFSLPRSLSIGESFWHNRRCFFERLLLITSCYGVDCPLHSLWSCSTLH